MKKNGLTFKKIKWIKVVNKDKQKENREYRDAKRLIDEALRKDKVIQLCDEMLFAGSHHMTHAFSPKKSPLKIQKKYNDGIS